MDTIQELKPKRPGLRGRSVSAAAHYNSPQNLVSKANAEDTHDSKKKHQHHRGLFHDTRHSHLPQLTKRSGESSGAQKNHLRQQLHHLKSVERLSNLASSSFNPGHEDRTDDAAYAENEEEQENAVVVRLPDREITDSDVERERRRNRTRDRELRKSLEALSKIASESTSKLDFIYYSILEKARTLQTMVINLHEVYTASKELHESFQRDVSNVDSEFKTQIEVFDEFKEQQRSIADFEHRIEQGKKRVEALNTRLENARRKVVQWEAREKEWQAKTSKRLTWGWVCAAIVFFLVIATIIYKHIFVLRTHNLEDNLAIEPVSLPDFIRDDLNELRERRRRSPALTANIPLTLTNDTKLAIFDEL